MAGRIDILQKQLKDLSDNPPMLVGGITFPGDDDTPGRESVTQYNNRKKELREEIKKETGLGMPSGRTMP